MNIEDRLKNTIERKFGNVKTFAEKIDLPYTTVRSILQRGVMNAKVENVIKIADGLNMRAEDLMSLDNTQSISTIYNQLVPPRQEKVYKFAEKQLEEQNSKITSLDDYRKRLDFPWKGFVSAGTGEFLDGEVNETISLYDDEIPTSADFALTVNGDSMKPMFKDHETIFVEETTELINGSIGIVIVNDEAYVKKVYHSTFGMTLVSLNDDYKDINVGKNDFIKIIGKVVI